MGRIAAGGDPTSTEHTASTVRLGFIATIGVGGAGGTTAGGTGNEEGGLRPSLLSLQASKWLISIFTDRFARV